MKTCQIEINILWKVYLVGFTIPLYWYAWYQCVLKVCYPFMDSFNLPKCTFFRWQEWRNKFPILIWVILALSTLLTDNMFTLQVACYFSKNLEFTQIVLWPSWRGECYILMPQFIHVNVHLGYPVDFRLEHLDMILFNWSVDIIWCLSW